MEFADASHSHHVGCHGYLVIQNNQKHSESSSLVGTSILLQTELLEHDRTPRYLEELRQKLGPNLTKSRPQLVGKYQARNPQCWEDHPVQLY